MGQHRSGAPKMAELTGGVVEPVHRLNPGDRHLLLLLRQLQARRAVDLHELQEKRTVWGRAPCFLPHEAGAKGRAELHAPLRAGEATEAKQPNKSLKK